MDVLIAEWPNGSLAASTFDMPAGYGEQFRASFEARGFVVTRMTANARRLQLEQGRRQLRAVREHPVTHPATASTEEVVAVVPEDQGLPAVGQSVRHQVFGAGTVAYHLTMPSGPVAVGRGPGWEGLLLPGVWENLAEHPTNLPQPEAGLAEYGDLKTPNSELPQPRQPLPLPTQMPSLFGDL